MARFFFYSLEGDALGIAYQLQRAHDVRWYVESPKAKNYGKGLVPFARGDTPDPRDTVIIDAVGAARKAAQWRRRGFSVFGGHPNEDWEVKREVGTRVMEEYGLRTPPTETFKTIRDALKFLEKAEGFWFFKPDGKSVPKRFTRGGDAAYLQRFLPYVEKKLPKDVTAFQLQQRIDGTEVSVCAYINQLGIVAADATIEEKKFGAGDTGPATGCQSNLVRDIPRDSRLFERTIGLFCGPLIELGCPITADLNCIITQAREIYGLEFTLRWGYDAIFAASLLWPGFKEFGEQLDAFTRNGLTKFHRDTDLYAMTLRLSLPPQPIYPIEGAEDYDGFPLSELRDDPLFFPDDIRVEGKHLVTAESGYVGVLGTTGLRLPGMRDNLVERAQAVKKQVQDLQFRTDPVERAEDTIDELEHQGFLPALRPEVLELADVPLPPSPRSYTQMPEPADTTSAPFRSHA